MRTYMYIATIPDKNPYEIERNVTQCQILSSCTRSYCLIALAPALPPSPPAHPPPPQGKKNKRWLQIETALGAGR